MRHTDQRVCAKLDFNIVMVIQSADVHFISAHSKRSLEKKYPWSNLMCVTTRMIKVSYC